MERGADRYFTDEEGDEDGVSNASSEEVRPASAIENVLAKNWRGCWRRVADAEILPPPRNSQGNCVASDGRYLYVFGGKSGGERLNDLWCFDAESVTWQCLFANEIESELGPQIRSGSLLVHDGSHTLYAAMGCKQSIVSAPITPFIPLSNKIYINNSNHSDDVNGVAHSSVWSFNLLTNEWMGPIAAEGSVPAARINFRGWFYASNIYIFGGSPDGKACFGDLWRFSIATCSWTQLHLDGDMPAPCQWPTVELWKDGQVIVFGGHGAEGESVPNFLILDLHRRKSRRLQQDLEESDKDEHRESEIWKDSICSSSASCIVGDRILFYGGWTGKNHRMTCFSLCLTNGEIHSVNPNRLERGQYPLEKCSSSATMYGGRFYVWSGWNGWRQLSEMHVINFACPALQEYCLKALLDRENEEEVQQVLRATHLLD